MSRILVAGNINIETSVRVAGFPINFESQTMSPFGIVNTVSGVGYNLARALAVLGDDVRFATMVGTDLSAAMIRRQIGLDGIDDSFVLAQGSASALSVLLY